MMRLAIAGLAAALLGCGGDCERVSPESTINLRYDSLTIAGDCESDISGGLGRVYLALPRSGDPNGGVILLSETDTVPPPDNRRDAATHDCNGIPQEACGGVFELTCTPRSTSSEPCGLGAECPFPVRNEALTVTFDMPYVGEDEPGSVLVGRPTFAGSVVVESPTCLVTIPEATFQLP